MSDADREQRILCEQRQDLAFARVYERVINRVRQPCYDATQESRGVESMMLGRVSRRIMGIWRSFS